MRAGDKPWGSEIYREESEIPGVSSKDLENIAFLRSTLDARLAKEQDSEIENWFESDDFIYPDELPKAEVPSSQGDLGEAEPDVTPDAHHGLGKVASSILMKILYIARYARFDLLRITCKLATRVTKWTAEDNKRLHRLMCYIASSYELRLTGWVGDKPNCCNMNLFCDADFAGDVCSQRSTSGVHLALQGPRTYFPLHGQSKKQTAVSFSTPEAELVAGLGGYQKTMLPALDLLKTYALT